MAIPYQHDYFSTTLNGAITDSATTIVMTAEATEVSDGQEIVFVLEPTSSSGREIIRGTKTGTSISGVTRGLGITSASAHDSLVVIRIAPTAVLHNLVADELNTPTGSGTTASTFTIDSDADAIILDTTGLTADRTFTFPDADGVVMTTGATQTATDKTFTSVVLNTGVTGTAVLDEDAMGSDSATQIATQQSIKAYVDTQTATLPTGSTLTDPVLNGTLSGTGISSSFSSPGSASILATTQGVVDYVTAISPGVLSYNGLTGIVTVNHVLQSQIYS